jgi:AcrR family transcriptional regulator
MVILSNDRIRTELPKLPPEAERDGTAGRILAAALLLFARKGYSGTSIRDIGEEIGLTSANLYSYFQNKEKLLAELVHLGHSEHHNWLRRAVVDAAPGPVAQLQSLIRAHVKWHAEYAMLGVVANNELHALSEAEVASSLSIRSSSQGLFQDVMRRGIAEGIFDVKQEFVTMAAVSGMGMRVANWYRPDFELSPDQIADIHAELATRMLMKRPEGIP